MNKIAGLLIIGLLAACNSDDDASDDTDVVSDIVITDPQNDNTDHSPITAGGVIGDNPFPWNRYLVTEFDDVLVDNIREMAAFVSNDFRFRLAVSDHPKFGGSGEFVDSQPLLAARLDYALSTGLTGAGQIVSMIDDGVRLTHEQFDDKTIYSSGHPPETGEFHGTAVASVLVGNGRAGGSIGFAPGADLHQGYLDYERAINWRALAGHMRQAKDLGAIVSNNSWGVDDFTLSDYDAAEYFSSATRRAYVDALKDFASDGVIVFAHQNDPDATSASLMAGVPIGVPELEPSWISVVNALPVFDDDRIQSADLISAPCLETARFCMAANGQIRVATEDSDSSYLIGIGASFAAPQVAGSVALLAEAFPDLTAAQLRDRLLVTADNGFFAHSGFVDFAPGLSHGYNAEFGHGFLDLRSALLPIGQPVVMLADGQSIDLGTAAITAGSAVGDGLARSLAAVTVVSTDQMHGSFALTADVLAADGQRVDAAATALGNATRTDVAATRTSLNAAIRSGTDLAGHRGAWADPSGASMAGSTAVPLVSDGNGFGLSVLTGDGTTGLAVQHSFDVAGGDLQLAVASTRTEGSVMGITVPRPMGVITSATTAVEIDFAAPIATDMAVRLHGEFGVASADGAGIVTDFTTMAYDRMGIAVERADSLRKGDVLALFARQPLAITRGSAVMDLPVQFANGRTSFASRSADLAPVERQLDLGFAYTAPVSRNGTLTWGLMHSHNDGNIADAQAISGFVGVQFRL